MSSPNEGCLTVKSLTRCGQSRAWTRILHTNTTTSCRYTRYRHRTYPCLSLGMLCASQWWSLIRPGIAPNGLWWSVAGSQAMWNCQGHTCRMPSLSRGESPIECILLRLLGVVRYCSDTGLRYRLIQKVLPVLPSPDFERIVCIDLNAWAPRNVSWWWSIVWAPPQNVVELDDRLDVFAFKVEEVWYACLLRSFF